MFRMCDSFLSKHYHRIVIIRYPPCNHWRPTILPIPGMLLVHRFQYLCKFTRVSVRYFFTSLHFDFNFLESLSTKSRFLCIKKERSISFLYVIFLDYQKIEKFLRAYRNRSCHFEHTDL